MSLSGAFDTHATAKSPQNLKRVKRDKPPSPFSLRLSTEERARLAAEAAGAPLGTYIRAKLLGEPVRARVRKTGISIADRRALAQLIALLGRSRVFSNLNQLAHAANTGSLPVTSETEAALAQALADLHEIRALLLTSVGLKPEAQP
ncbi:conserved hypothetical protein [Methylorubrum populi BJ001]|jgi:hypothetical protein|uniref:Bacterial mobilisation domain-containing protein n=1 Tax=Methylorubrum populi (strain ATCC BAA-705 / NCIMB 13946 / BJ001) TaxID=441620 RepID=B1Z8U5_METPB|nr:hypothetical protein [Methylorubrum populi]ACB83245.1 conserved hypothetical protein [Methylorubrum populi BJ001]OAH38214.1 hypothetical protein AX289_12205 [Methylorubrum populi]PZP68197.1 MAG: hypothetical protein DI590_17800 [Methylorubrum populi]